MRLLAGLAAGALSVFFTWAFLIFALYVVGGNVILGRECDLDANGGKACNGIGRFADDNEPLVLGGFLVVAVIVGIATLLLVARGRSAP